MVIPRPPLALLLGFLPVTAALAQSTAADPAPALYAERYRPQYHFTPPQNWMNDPNGLVYYDGEYHLFYQYNPLGNVWGHMSWGHAVSRDLLHWTHLPVAIPEAGKLMAFSGSAVVDWPNTSGFGRDGKPPLVALYTGHVDWGDHQSQYLAYSNDHGRTWANYPDNPVLDLHLADFRDPKVMWYAPSNHWVMTVALPKEHRMCFYWSDNLKDWKLSGTFGPAGSMTGEWECPDLFRLPVAGTKQESKWVLIVNVSDGGANGGSACQYFVGEFDGSRFTPDQGVGAASVHWADYGRDFYAAASWSDVPATDGRRLWLGWMNNWKYGQAIPTSPWRSAQSLVRELGLVRDAEGWHLTQQPVREYQSLRGPEVVAPARAIPPGRLDLAPAGVRGDVLELQMVLEPGAAKEAGLTILAGGGRQTRLGYDRTKGRLFVDRTNSGEEFHPAFAGRHEAPLLLRDGRVSLHVFIDRSTVEVFAADGQVVLSEQVFAPVGANAVGLFAEGGEARLVSLSAWPLHGVWPPPPTAR